MLLSTQYIALRPDLIRRHRLTPTLALIYSALIDRMLSSRRHGTTYYDAQKQAYFVNYSQPTMAADYGLSLSTTQRAYDQLVQRGLLVKRHRYNASDILYLPEMAGWLYRGPFKMTRPAFSFCQPNHLTLNQSFRPTVKTVDTSETAADGPSPQDVNPVPVPAPSQAPAPVPEPAAIAVADVPEVAQLEFSALAQSLTQRGGIPADAVAHMARLAYHNYKTLYTMGRVVYQSKRAVSIMAERGAGAAGLDALRWETNVWMAEDFSDAIVRILLAAFRKNRQHWEGYAYTALRHYFEDAANAWLREQKRAETEALAG